MSSKDCMYTIKMRTDRLQPGMVIMKDVCSGNGLILVPEGTVVTSEVKTLITRHFIEYVYIDYKAEDEPEEPKQKVTSHTQKDSEHYEKFKANFQVAEEDVANCLEDIVFRDKNIDVQNMLETLNTIIGRSNSNMDLCDMLFYMKEMPGGVYNHSINVALIGQLLAQWLKLDKKEVEMVSLCGLMHDIGKLKLPERILYKKTPLTNAEKLEYEKHSIIGYNIIKNKDIDYQIKQTVLTHHERLDGSGYPLQIRADKITKLSRIIAIADTYDRMTSKQPERDAISPFEVVHNFEVNGSSKFDIGILMTFLANILNNFVHYKVLLSNGQTGEVVFINKYDLSRPLIKVVGGGFIDLSVRKDLKILKVES